MKTRNYDKDIADLSRLIVQCKKRFECTGSIEWLASAQQYRKAQNFAFRQQRGQELYFILRKMT